MQSRAQSAMEYLMTYGWAILIIAVVLAILYQLGIFGGTALLSSSCIASTGFLCSSAQLNTTGNLIIQFAQSTGQTVTVTGIACTNTTVVPNTVQSITPVQLAAGQKTNLVFSCPLSSNLIGTKFSGFLWVQYNTQQQSGNMGRVGSITVPVSTTQSVSSSSGSAPTTTIHYVPITLTNSQAQATGSNFQQYTTVNPSLYSTYESSDLGNVRFYSGNPNTGTGELYSWCESGCTSGSGSAVFWVTLPSGIGASSAVTVNMAFSPNTPYDANFAGEAPQLSASYGQYDNGANVFQFYDNFAGSSLSGKWQTSSCSSGYTIGAYSVSNGITITIAGDTTHCIHLYTTSQYSPAVVDEYVSAVSAFATEYEWYYSVSAPNSASPTSIGNFWYSNANYHTLDCRNSGSTACPWVGIGGNAPPGIESVLWPATGTESEMHNYGVIQSATNTLPVHANSYIGMYATSPGVTEVTGTMTMKWVRQRAYPPSGVMPSVSAGSLV